MKDKNIIYILLLSILVIIWFWQNPIGKFGYHGFGFMVYSGIPFIYFDLKIHENAIPSIRGKSHWISLDEISDLISENSDFLIIGTGYDGLVNVDDRILNLSIFNSTTNVEVMETNKAIERFNELKDGGRRVTAIIHSTC